MRNAITLMILSLVALTSVADDDGAHATPPAAIAPSSLGTATSVAHPASITRVIQASDSETTASDGAPLAAKFSSDAKWDLAGYNNNEVVYTILITNRDSRILRCTTELQGWFFENGKKQSISDRQLSTVFPDQQIQVGNWMGMDQQSGATYSVHCHPV